MEIYEAVNSSDALAINAAVSAATSDFNLDETRFAEQSLDEPLESVSRKLLCQHVVKLAAP